MTSTQVACGAFLLFVFTLVWSMVRENNKRKKKFLEKIKKSWGAVPTREYSWDELEQISAYHKAQPKNSFVIDEITWNDFDMNRIFMLMNQTVSSAGEDYLYAMLHRPEFSEERLKERERLFCFLKKEEKTRLPSRLADTGNSFVCALFGIACRIYDSSCLWSVCIFSSEWNQYYHISKRERRD